MKRIIGLTALVLALLIVISIVFKLDTKPDYGESSGTQTESPSDKPQESSGGTSEDSGDNELKITLSCTQWNFTTLKRISGGSSESGGDGESGDQSDGKVTGIEIKPGEILFGE